MQNNNYKFEEFFEVLFDTTMKLTEINKRLKKSKIPLKLTGIVFPRNFHCSDSSTEKLITRMISSLEKNSICITFNENQEKITFQSISIQN